MFTLHQFLLNFMLIVCAACDYVNADVILIIVVRCNAYHTPVQSVHIQTEACLYLSTCVGEGFQKQWHGDLDTDTHMDKTI